jgi:AmmeMemoRadiSam system protein A
MEPSHFIDLSTAARLRLLHIARSSIGHGLVSHQPLAIGKDELPGVLGEPLASFVTLRHQEMLRGCVGSLEAIRPLAEAVAVAAFSAAFKDSRFPPLREEELHVVNIEISVLSALEPMTVTDEHSLLGQLEPGLDGLLLDEQWHRATFLPKVWEQLGDPAAFLQALKLKAGLPPDYWSESLRFRRYRTVSFSDQKTATPAVA